MKHDIHIRIHDIEGSTVFHAVVSPRSTSEGCSGGMPLEDNVPPLHKPAVLATIIPDPSQGTPGTAIRAAPHNMGTAPSRTSRQEVRRKTGWLEGMQTELYRQHLALQVLGLLYCSMLRYLLLAIRPIIIDREQFFQTRPLPNVWFTSSAHDRKFAVFRRRAV